MKRTYTAALPDGSEYTFTSNSKHEYKYIVVVNWHTNWKQGWKEGGRHTTEQLAEKRRDWWLQGHKPEDVRIVELN